MGVGHRLAGTDLRGRDLRGADLRAADLRGARLDDADLRGADLWAANVSRASLRRCDLRGARLVQASFAGSDLRASNIAGADTHMTDFEGAHVACVNNGRAPKGYWVEWATIHGWPTFADVMRHHLTVLHCRPGDALWAIDAARDASPDIMRELHAFAEHGPAAAGAVACARLNAPELAPVVVQRLRMCREYEVRTLAAVAVYLGVPKFEVCSKAKDKMFGHKYLEQTVDKLVPRIRAWPSPDSLPPPYRPHR